MANAFYPKYKQSVITEGDTLNGLDQVSPNAPIVSLINLGVYTYNTGHQFYTSLAGAIVGTDQVITSNTVSNGTLAGGNVTFSSVAGGTTVSALVITRANSGATSTWRLVLYEDTSVVGLPVLTNGGNIVVTWNVLGIATICDKRLKKNIRQIGRHGDLPLYDYEYQFLPGVRSIGVMAQDVERIAPEAIGSWYVGDKQFKTVNYTALSQKIQ